MQNVNNSRKGVPFVNFCLTGALLMAFFLFSTQAVAQKKEPVPGKGGTVAGFEVDAHFQSGAIPAEQGFWVGANPAYTPNITTYGADWTGPAGVLLKDGGGNFIPGETADKQTLWKIDGNSGNQSQYPEVDVFSGTSNKNSDLIASGQSPWSVKSASGGPQKNDITNVMVHVREATNGDKWLMFAYETRSTDGTSYGDIEYNQLGLALFPNEENPTQIIGNGPGNLGGRSIGDFILSVDFSGGGNNPTIAVRELEAGGVWSSPLAVGQNYFLTVAILDVDPVIPNGGFNGNGSPSNTSSAFQLVEGAINLTATGLEPDVCSPDATFMFKTRSSDSFTAELKDLTLFKFAITPPATMSALSPQAKCPGENASFTVNVAGDGANGANVEWFKDNVSLGAGTSFDATSSTLALTNLATSDAGTYKAVLNNATCGSPNSSAVLTVYATPVGGPASQAVCPNTIGGSAGTFNLTSLESAVINGAANVTLEGWYEDAAFSTAIGSPGAYVSGSTTVYAKLIGEGNCVGMGQATLTVDPSPTGNNDAIALCPTDIDGTTASFDLTTVEANVINGNTLDGWFEDAAFSTPIGSPGAFVSATGNRVYAKFSDANSCIGSAYVDLTVYTSPTVADVSMEDCPDVSGGSTATFDLTTKESEAANGNTFVAWYEDAGLTTLIQSPGSYETSGGTVYGKITSNEGCLGIAQNVLTVNPSAAAPIVQYHAPDCEEPNFIVEVTNPTDGATYNIVDKDGLNPASVAYSSGDDNPSFSRPAGSGYSITATIGDCESLPAECSSSAQAAKAAEEESARVAQAAAPIDGQVKIYPVPFSTKTTVEFYAKADGAYAVNLHDMSGKLVRKLEEGSTNAGDFHRVEVEGNQLADGMYLVVVLNGQEKQAVRIIKER